MEALTGDKLDFDSPAEVEQYLTRIEPDHAQPPTPPVTLVEFVELPLDKLGSYLTPQELALPVELFIEWENQSTSICALNDKSLSRLAVPGYHVLTVRTTTRRFQLRWILAPARCYMPGDDQPLNGINCFLPALRSLRNWGAGDLTDLSEFATRLAAEANFDFIALNPLHSIHNRTPYNTSPYLPLSIFTGNLLYLDIEAIPEFRQSEAAQRIAKSTEFQQRLSQLRTSEFVNYEEVARIKTFFLRLLHREFLRTDRTELDEYRTNRGPWLNNYCTYMAFDRYFHRKDPNLWYWRQWPLAFQSRHSDESQKLAQQLHRLIDFFAFVEMRLEQQLESAHRTALAAGYQLGLYQDLALATDRVGADYWSYQELFAPGVRVGSPPDDFNENGQDWGFPALHPKRHAEAGYGYFVESIRCAARHAGAIRFDHVMRLARLYWIPDNMSARDGAYVRDHFEDLLKILSLESQRARVLVVGEDLGTVPGYFRKALDECGVLSYRLILFERSGSVFKPAAEFPHQAIASFTTHDLPTFTGWLHGTDLEDRLATGQLPLSDLEAARRSRAEDIAALREAFEIAPDEKSDSKFFESLCRFLAETPSRLRLLNLEELTSELHQQNMPGTTSESPNWQRRVHLPLETLFSEPAFSSRLATWSKAIQSGVER